jgi:glutathione S-transferase
VGVSPTECIIIGRSSSTFTRVARIFAAELAVPYTLDVVRDLGSVELETYGGNPALKVPSLRTPNGTWFGALNACRELARLSTRELCIVWPEALDQPLLANMLELTLHAMATEVGLIMSSLPKEPAETMHRAKMHASLHHTLSWLDTHLQQVLAALPADRHLSYLETCLFCLVTHLEFRNVAPIAPYPALATFCENLALRPSCQGTEFRFDT